MQPDATLDVAIPMRPPAGVGPVRRAQEDPAFWISHQERASVIDRRILERRG